MLVDAGVIIFQIAPTKVGAELYKLGRSGQNLYNFGTIFIIFWQKIRKNPKNPEILFNVAQIWWVLHLVGGVGCK